MSQIFEVNPEQWPLKGFEEIILTRRGCDALLPATILREADRARIVFGTDDHWRFREYPFQELADLFHVITSYIHGFAAVENHLLDPNRIPICPSLAYIHGKTRAVRFVYGTPPSPGNADLPARIRTVAAEMQALHGIIGAQSAMTQLIDQIGNTNPGRSTLLKMVENLEREWNKIHPAA